MVNTVSSAQGETDDFSWCLSLSVYFIANKKCQNSTYVSEVIIQINITIPVLS